MEGGGERREREQDLFDGYANIRVVSDGVFCLKTQIHSIYMYI